MLVPNTHTNQAYRVSNSSSLPTNRNSNQLSGENKLFSDVIILKRNTQNDEGSSNRSVVSTSKSLKKPVDVKQSCKAPCGVI